METEKNKRQSEIIKKIENKPRLRQNYEIIKLLFKYIKENKKWWLLPFLIVLIFFGIFISFAGNSSVMPLIYALF
jgi:hypothetical protein